MGKTRGRLQRATPVPIARLGNGDPLVSALELTYPDPSAVSVQPGLPENNPPAAGSGSNRSPLLIGLLASFEAQKVGHCCWKSTRRASRGMTGASDLDLLIARTDRRRATELLLLRGFKHWPDAPGYDNPAISSFFGYDETTGVIYHVHVQFKLVFGHSVPIRLTQTPATCRVRPFAGI